MPTQPRPEQLQNFSEKAPEGPIYMLNLLKFKERAEYADGRETELSGAEAYGLYGAAVRKIVEGFSGQFHFFGHCNALVIGDGELAWDAVGIMEYPSLEAFQGMVGSSEYGDIHVHREAGLDHQLLINCLSPEQAMAVAQAAALSASE